MPSPSSAVSLRGLTRRFGDLTAVDGLTFDVAPGELFGIVGPDGAGKTTSMRMLAGILRPSSGTVHIQGIDVGEDPEAVKPHIAYMAQRFGLYDDLTVEENLDFYADLYRVPRTERPARLERLYSFSRLDEFSDRLAGNLSGGMKQKLALSCSLVHHPRILLLDEPTFGVDPISRRELWLILHEMVAEGITVVVSTSYLDEAERCDESCSSTTAGCWHWTSHRPFRQLWPETMVWVRADHPRTARDVLRGMPAIRSAALFGDAVHVLLDDDANEEAVTAPLTAAGVSVLDVEEVDPSLEDVFIHLVGASDG